MVKSLLALIRSLRQAWLIEVAGAGLVVAGLAVAWGLAAALIGSGVALLLKAFEVDAQAVS